MTAMAYRLPHVVCHVFFTSKCHFLSGCLFVNKVGSNASILQVMGDRSGNIRWWDVTTGQSSSFNTHREGIRRIKFSPVVLGDRSRGRIAVLFYDNTFSVFDLVSEKFPLLLSLHVRQYSECSCVLFYGNQHTWNLYDFPFLRNP